MAGWNLKSGLITEYDVCEERIWSLFNYVFSDSSRKRNTYKFGIIKSLLDSLFSGKKCEKGMYYTYEMLFTRFAENYWNLIVKYDLRQMRKDDKSVYSKIESIYMNSISENPIISALEFSSICDKEKEKIILKVIAECKKCVIGALYEDFEGIIYSFDLKEKGLYLNYCVYDFMLKYKAELEKLNYYSWARFLERINEDEVLLRVIDKLELATPRRRDLTIYRDILRHEFEEDTCFYCGKKLQRRIQVDHFIPWAFVKDDKVWNFVLACSNCNERKSNRIPDRTCVVRIESRNNKMRLSGNLIVQEDFAEYSEGLIERMWHYARLSGLKEYINTKIEA